MDIDMGYSQADKAQSRERILAKAAEQIRDTGLESISVGKLMRSVDLTHGGFYGHFASRSDLLAQALERALEDGATTAKLATDPTKPPTYAGVVRSYLSRNHRDSRKTGCALAALSSDVARADEHSRAVMEAYIERFVAKVADVMEKEDDQDALLAVSAMIGGLLVSRMMTDPKRSDEVLRSVRNALMALQDEGKAT
ncbi:MAG: TetR/AcrR family transcriptional regulator [Burkholderiaceae bacterium]